MQSRIVKLMGTVITLKIEHETAEVLLAEAERRLNDYQQRFSANQEDSLLMEVNRQAGLKPVKVDKELFDLIALGRQISIASDRKLNIAIGPLTKLWHIGFQDAHVPTEQEIQARLKRIQPENILLDETTQTVFLAEKGMEIDLGCIAKGYFADQLKLFFTENGVKQGIIDLGGNVLTIGEAPNHEDGYWRVGIQNPKQARGHLVATLPIKNQSLVTSGIYERKLTIGEQTYHHIFHSQTGYPIESEIASVSIQSDQSIDGEIWTTILFAETPERAIAWLNQLEGIEGIILTRDQRMYVSEALKERITILHN